MSLKYTSSLLKILYDSHSVLDGDHYKWRAMRTLGIAEKLITGKETSNKEKFDQWAYTVPFTAGNPLFHWTHLELKRYFGINTLLQPSTSTAIFKVK